MTDEAYVFHETNRERKRNGYGDQCKVRQGGRYVRLPSDNLSKKEREKMNGEVVTYPLDIPRTWEEYKTLPDDIKAEYITHLYEKYHVGQAMLARMFGVNRITVKDEYDRRGLVLPKPRGPLKREQMDAWDRFLGEAKPAEILPKEEVKIADLIVALAGTGAKITIEITL